ncbi:MAG: hypothetical protein IPG77_24365 [Betaproteobacteria bacterium]|nr:hypothetical protein [Betaproteobacteria bacterium]
MMKKGMALFVCAVAMLWTGVADAAESLRFFTASPVAAIDAASAGEKQVTRANVATLEPEVRSYLRAPASGDPANIPKVDLQLFDDVRLTLRERSRTKSRGTTSTVEFAIEGDGGGRAVIVITDDVVFGSIHTGSHKNFRVMHRHDGQYAIEELDQAAFPECGNAEAHDIPGHPPQPSAPDAGADDGSVIRVLVAYTQASENWAGGSAGIANVIATAVAESNAGLAVSGVGTNFQLAHAVKVNYNELVADAYSAALNRVTNAGDGVMDEIHALRDSFQADLVVLLINEQSYCGMAWLPGTVSSANAHLGFSVTNVSCATGYYSFAHEIGHNMGARHDAYVDTGTTPYAYAKGYVNLQARIRSIMAYDKQCADTGFNCTRVNHWSAADRTYAGAVIGSTSARNNVALGSSALAIANYRVSPDTRTLTVTKAGTGSGTVTSSPSGINCGTTCSASFALNTSVTLTAAPASGSTFGGWSGACTGTTSTCVVSMSTARTVTATFVGGPPTLTVTKAGTGSGTVVSSPSGINCGATCNSAFALNSSVTLLAASASGSTFGGWSGPAPGPPAPAW